MNRCWMSDACRLTPSGFRVIWCRSSGKVELEVGRSISIRCSLPRLRTLRAKLPGPRPLSGGREVGRILAERSDGAIDRSRRVTAVTGFDTGCHVRVEL